MNTRLTERLARLALHLPWNRLTVSSVLSRRSEISLLESRFLGDLVRRAPPAQPIIEIGTLFGASTRTLCLFKALETPLITVDSFRWNPHGLPAALHARITQEALQEGVQSQNVKLVRSDKREFYRAYSGPAPGLVFLDANHGYMSTREDIEWAKSVGAGIVCGHDYKEKFPGVIQAVDEHGGPRELVGSLFVLGRD